MCPSSSFCSQTTGLRVDFLLQFSPLTKKKLSFNRATCFVFSLLSSPWQPTLVYCQLGSDALSFPLSPLHLSTSCCSCYLLLGVAVALGSNNTAFSIMSKSIAKHNFHQVCRQTFGLVCSHVAKNWPHLFLSDSRYLSKAYLTHPPHFFLLSLAVWERIYAHPFCSSL